MIELIHSWENPTSSKRNTIVFANRNQLYGAYALRERYEKILAKAFVFTFSACVILMLIPTIISSIKGNKMIVFNNEKEVVYELIDTQIIKPEVVPELPKQQVAAIASTFQFKVPKVTDDLINDHPPVQDPNNNENPGVINQPSDSNSIGDNTPADTTTIATPIVNITDVQEVPMFPGGTSGMMNYLISNIHYPYAAKEANIHGTIYISFVIDKEGRLIDANVLRGIGGGCDEEALRVVKNMPVWTAGKQNGRAVMVRMILPVQFSLR